jgi:hypothetical protein
MGEERIWVELSQVKTDVGKLSDKVGSIGSDVTDIKDALLGDQYGNKGYADRICELEGHCDIVRNEISTSKIYRKALVYIGSAIIGSGGVFSIIKFILPLINN